METLVRISGRYRTKSWGGVSLQDRRLHARCSRCISEAKSLAWVEQAPKTSNAVRVVDIPEPLAASLMQFIAGRTRYAFSAANGKPLCQRNALRTLYSRKRIGFHSLRRFRTETLRRARVPEDLIRLWLGHSSVVHNRLLRWRVSERRTVQG